MEELENDQEYRMESSRSLNSVLDSTFLVMLFCYHLLQILFTLLLMRVCEGATQVYTTIIVL